MLKKIRVQIKNTISDLKEIKSVEASADKADKGKVFVVYQGQRPNTNIFRKENYLLSDQPVKITEKKEN